MNGYDMPSQSATSPIDIKDASPNHAHHHHHQQNQHQMMEPKEEKQAQPMMQEEETDNVEHDFLGTLSFSDCVKLQIGDHIDHRDDVGRFLLATIVDKDEYKVKIHYEGWNSKWDTWCNYKSETHRFAAPRSISR